MNGLALSEQGETRRSRPGRANATTRLVKALLIHVAERNKHDPHLADDGPFKGVCHEPARQQRRAPKPRTDKARAAYDWNDIPIPPEGRACGRGLHSFARRPHLLLAGVAGIAGVSSLRLQSPDHRWPFQHTVTAASAGPVEMNGAVRDLARRNQQLGAGVHGVDLRPA